VAHARRGGGRGGGHVDGRVGRGARGRVGVRGVRVSVVDWRRDPVEAAGAMRGARWGDVPPRPASRQRVAHRPPVDLLALPPPHLVPRRARVDAAPGPRGHLPSDRERGASGGRERGREAGLDPAPLSFLSSAPTSRSA
jgi:hypothetical protein